MKARINYIRVALIILAIGQMAFFFVSSLAEKPAKRTDPPRLYKELTESPSVAVTVTVVNNARRNDPPLLPDKFSLSQNYPNPFNANTTIRYDVPTTGPVRLTIFNLLGQRVATLVDGRHLAGFHSIVWDASHLPSGIYFCQMDAPGYMQTRKLLLVK